MTRMAKTREDDADVDSNAKETAVKRRVDARGGGGSTSSARATVKRAKKDDGGDAGRGDGEDGDGGDDGEFLVGDIEHVAVAAHLLANGSQGIFATSLFIFIKNDNIGNINTTTKQITNNA